MFRLIKFFAIFVPFVFLACAGPGEFLATETIVIGKPKQDELNIMIKSLATQLLNSAKPHALDSKPIILTSSVNLDNFKKTTKFGRMLSESMIHELDVRGFKILDYRKAPGVLVNRKGEFNLSRNTKRISSKIGASYVFVATYSKLGRNLMVNARILDLSTSGVVSSARFLYHIKDCQPLGLCTKYKIIPPKDIQLASSDKKAKR